MKNSLKEKKQKREKKKWIKNVMRVQGKTKEEAEKLYQKIYKNK